MFVLEIIHILSIYILNIFYFIPQILYFGKILKVKSKKF